VLKSEIKPSVEYAFREKRTPGAPVQRVRVIEHIRGNKWKVVWIEPNPGLVHYAESAQIVATWKGHKAFLREEEDRDLLLKRNNELGYSENSPIANALYEIFENTGEKEVSFYKGDLRGTPAGIDRIRTRAGLKTGQSFPYSYADRQGVLHLPFDETLEIARKFCAAEPSTVLAGIEATERQWAQEIRVPGNEHQASLLSEYRAAWALIRQWTGFDPAIAEREKTIEMLERLVWDAVYALQKAGLDHEAARLRRAIERR